MTAFDLAPSLQRFAADCERATSATVAALEQHGAFDPGTGRVEIDTAALTKVVLGITRSKPATEQLVQWAQYLADGGLASVPSAAEPALIPWRSLEDIVAARRGTPPGLREFLGVELGADPRDAEEQVRTRFPELPPDVFGGHVAPFLGREPGQQGGNGGGYDPDHRPPASRPPVGGIPVVPAPPTADIGAAVDCFKNATYTGLDGGTGWTSWFWGFRVCFDHSCAQTVGETVLSLASPGALDLIKGIYALITQGLVAAIEGFLTWIMVIITIAIATLGLWITTSDQGRGVCLCLMWAGPFWVSAR